jgi:hypothetical protein
MLSLHTRSSVDSYASAAVILPRILPANLARSARKDGRLRVDCLGS